MNSLEKNQHTMDVHGGKHHTDTNVDSVNTKQKL